MKQKHKDWLIKNKITSLNELFKKFEITRQAIDTIPIKERKIYCDLVYFFIYKEDVLNSFFCENKKTQESNFEGVKNDLLVNSDIVNTPTRLLELLKCNNFSELRLFLKSLPNNTNLQKLGIVYISKGNVGEQIKECFTNYERPIDMHWNSYAELMPHIKFTILEQNIITEKEQEKLSRNHIGHSTRHKAGIKMIYLDEVVGDKEKKVIEQLEDKTDRAYMDSGIKESQSVQKAPIFTYCKVNKNALEALSLRALYGHNTYKETDHDWQNFTRVPNGDFEYANAQFRHALDIGEENEEAHLIASAWNAVARLEIFLREKNKK